jgi:S-adenosylmethionine:tRNA ribosyltransferase-isomerase
VLEKSQRGEYLVQFRPMQNSPDPVEAIADRVGSVPLPPYIQRPVEGKAQLDDEQRYQTVYADPAKKWAAAAPTAGLHFTDKSLNELGRRNIPTYDLTLRIGLGTFRPIAVANVESHAIHTERYSIPASSVQALIAETTRPVVAVGTTTVRAIEDFARKSATAQPSGTHPPTEEFSSDASLYIYPPDTFHLTDALLTNFHLPRSTLMCLVAAFLTPGEVEGINWLKEIYRQAIRFKYRFYSYGDAMFIR